MTRGAFHVGREGNVDGDEKGWDSFNCSEKLKVFGHRSFLPFQREVINATMSKHDVFALMPPGGGKRLTYQLPALISGGMTLVISPFIHELKKADVPISATSLIEEKDIHNEPTSLSSEYNIVYVTPQVAKSEALLERLNRLYCRQMLTRIVIEETHCVSKQGHDFREDYLDFGFLKQKFPDIPVLAFTARATASVEDVVQALGLVDCIVFRQTFNRPNIRYSVIPKRNGCVEDIAKFIADNHSGEKGIIYCLSRLECEEVAEKLKNYGHKAAFYHWGLSQEECASLQKKWSEDDVDIICETEAFGTGINKLDVRFVIHHSLPKSIEDYYQACSRAGRDGNPASCVLYYKYHDSIRVKRVIIRDHVAWARTCSRNLLEKCINDLHKMVGYSENGVDCRCLLLLYHCGEEVDDFKCRRQCDNCSKAEKSMLFGHDATKVAKKLIDAVTETGQKFSLDYIVKFFQDSIKQDSNYPANGVRWSKAETIPILHHLVVKDYLVEDVTFKKRKHASILKVNGSKAANLKSGCDKIILRFDMKWNVALYVKEAESASASASASRKRVCQRLSGLSGVFRKTDAFFRS